MAAAAGASWRSNGRGGKYEGWVQALSCIERKLRVYPGEEMVETYEVSKNITRHKF